MTKHIIIRAGGAIGNPTLDALLDRAQRRYGPTFTVKKISLKYAAGLPAAYCTYQLEEEREVKD